MAGRHIRHFATEHFRHGLLPVFGGEQHVDEGSEAGPVRSRRPYKDQDVEGLISAPGNPLLGPDRNLVNRFEAAAGSIAGAVSVELDKKF